LVEVFIAIVEVGVVVVRELCVSGMFGDRELSSGRLFVAVRRRAVGCY